MNREYALAPGVIGSVSTSALVEPVTRRPWERVGIEPDIAVPPALVLEATHMAALERLMEREENPRLRREMEWARDFLRGQVQPVAGDPAALRTFYGVVRRRPVVMMMDGALYYRRRAQRPRPLGTIAPTRFALTPEWQIEIRPSGDSLELYVEHVSGQAATAPKEP